MGWHLMQINFTAFIPGKSWGSFLQSLHRAALTHRVVWVKVPRGFHISWVPGAKINQLVDKYQKDQ